MLTLCSLCTCFAAQMVQWQKPGGGAPRRDVGSLLQALSRLQASAKSTPPLAGPISTMPSLLSHAAACYLPTDASLATAGGLLQELMTQGVVASIFARDARLRQMVDALQPEGGLLPVLASRGALLRTLVEQRLLKRLIDQVCPPPPQASASLSPPLPPPLSQGFPTRVGVTKPLRLHRMCWTRCWSDGSCCTSCWRARCSRRW
jgi:hypothetical protein